MMHRSCVGMKAPIVMRGRSVEPRLIFIKSERRAPTLMTIPLVQYIYIYGRDIFEYIFFQLMWNSGLEL